ncbi:hypothetical protein YC2023_121981 [Brassica napus]
MFKQPLTDLSFPYSFASELAPASSSLLAKLLEQYLDPCAVRVVEGAVTETTLLLEQKWNKIFYTGSSRIGRIIMTAAVKHLTPVSLELGGKSLVVIDSDTNLDVKKYSPFPSGITVRN